MDADLDRAVKMLRGDAAYELDRANNWNERGWFEEPTPWTLLRAWELADRANILAAAADALEDAANVRGAMDAQDERERAAGASCGVPYEESGCDWPETVADALAKMTAERDTARDELRLATERHAKERDTTTWADPSAQTRGARNARREPMMPSEKPLAERVSTLMERGCRAGTKATDGEFRCPGCTTQVECLAAATAEHWTDNVIGVIADVPEPRETVDPRDARIAALEAALGDALAHIVENTNANRAGYGDFPGGDPRSFDPDPECSTDAEREAHRLACEAWDRGEQTPLEPAHVWVPRAEAEAAMGAGHATVATLNPVGLSHLSRVMFGLGSYTYPDPETDELIARLRALLPPANEVATSFHADAQPPGNTGESGAGIVPGIVSEPKP